MSLPKYGGEGGGFLLDNSSNYFPGGEGGRLGYSGEGGLMILGKTAASSVVITPIVANNMRKNLNKQQQRDGRRRRILRPSLNLSPLKISSELASSLKLHDLKEDKLKAMREDSQKNVRRRTLSPCRSSALSSSGSSSKDPRSLQQKNSASSLLSSESYANDVSLGGGSRVPETVLTRSERIAKRVVPPRARLMMRPKESDDDSSVSSQTKLGSSSKGPPPSGSWDEGGDGTTGRVDAMPRPNGEKGSNKESLRSRIGQVSLSKKVEEEPEPIVAKPRLVNNVQYKYKLYPGNNSLVITQALRKRPWMNLSRDENDVAKKSYKATGGESGETKEVANEDAMDLDLIWEQYRLAKRYKTTLYKDTVLNHIQGNPSLVTKKGLYFSLRKYCDRTGMDLGDIVPRTYFLHCNGQDPSEQGEGRQDDTAEFSDYNQTLEEEVVWICKPSSLTNRGYGIVVLKGVNPVLTLVNRALTASPRPVDDGEDAEKPSVESRKKRMAKKSGMREGYIVQEYITKPLLVRGRKFDIRCYVLLHLDKSKNGDNKLRAYFHEHMYVRTSGKKYSLNDLEDKECHLTNDAVQQKCATYGKFEPGNKLNMNEWQAQIDRDYSGAPGDIVQANIIPRMKELTSISISAALDKLEKSSVNKSFELLGYDYMVSDDFQPLLIEVNSNPCLEFSCPLLSRMIPDVISDTFKLSVDQLLPPPPEGSRTKNCEAVVAGILSEKNLFEELKIDR